jgi:hypothetical protein
MFEFEFSTGTDNEIDTIDIARLQHFVVILLCQRRHPRAKRPRPRGTQPGSCLRTATAPGTWKPGGWGARPTSETLSPCLLLRLSNTAQSESAVYTVDNRGRLMAILP